MGSFENIRDFLRIFLCRRSKSSKRFQKLDPAAPDWFDDCFVNSIYLVSYGIYLEGYTATISTEYRNFYKKKLSSRQHYTTCASGISGDARSSTYPGGARGTLFSRILGVESPLIYAVGQSSRRTEKVTCAVLFFNRRDPPFGEPGSKRFNSFWRLFEIVFDRDSSAVLSAKVDMVLQAETSVSAVQRRY